MARIDESPKLVRDLTELHDRIANACIRAIVTEPLHIGGDSADCMLIVASVVMGVNIAWGLLYPEREMFLLFFRFAPVVAISEVKGASEEAHAGKGAH